MGSNMYCKDGELVYLMDGGGESTFVLVRLKTDINFRALKMSMEKTELRWYSSEDVLFYLTSKGFAEEVLVEKCIDLDKL